MFPSLFQGGRWLIYKDFEELPLTLNAKDIADVLGISKSYAYNLFYRKDFPTLTIVSKEQPLPTQHFDAHGQPMKII